MSEVLGWIKFVLFVMLWIQSQQSVPIVGNYCKMGDHFKII